MTYTATDTLTRLRGIRSYYTSESRRIPGWDAVARRNIVEVLIDYYGQGERSSELSQIDIFLACLIKEFERHAELEAAVAK